MSLNYSTSLKDTVKCYLFIFSKNNKRKLKQQRCLMKRKEERNSHRTQSSKYWGSMRSKKTWVLDPDFQTKSEPDTWLVWGVPESITGRRGRCYVDSWLFEQLTDTRQDARPGMWSRYSCVDKYDMYYLPPSYQLYEVFEHWYLLVGRLMVQMIW